MTEAGRDIALKIESARIAFTGKVGNERSCKVQVIASHRKLPEDAVLWFASLEGVSGSTFSLQAELIESGAGFYLCEHQALQNVKLELCLENDSWRLELSCELFSMGWDPNTIRVRTALELCEDFDVMGA
jgi:hypothetical protein